MTRRELEREKKDFIGFILIGILIHIATIAIVVVQLCPEVTITGIIRAIFFGLFLVGTLVAYWINMSRYAKAIKNAEKKLEEN